MKKRSSYHSAFTLIEIAMVLIIMGIIVGSSTKIFVSMSKNAKVQETKALLQLIALDIEGFSATFNRLPTSEELNGFHMQMHDAWGKPIRYIPSKSLLAKICQQTKSDLEHHQQAKKVKNLGFILLSSGANRNLQTAVEQKENTIIKSAKMSEVVDYDTATINRIEAYDDLYLSRSLWSLQGGLRCGQRTFP